MFAMPVYSFHVSAALSTSVSIGHPSAMYAGKACENHSLVFNGKSHKIRTSGPGMYGT